MKRVLCIISCMDTGGAETFLMKIFRKLDREKYQMDFCVNVTEKNYYEDEIKELGGKIFRIPPKSDDLKKFRKELYRLVKEEKYNYVLRIGSSGMSFMELKIAKKAGAQICSVRSSNSSDGGSLKSKLAHIIGKILYSRYIDVKVAPSDLAALYTFGKRAYQNGDVTILHNAVDLNTYKYSEEYRKKIRAEFNIKPEAVVVGHIGRFMTQKNHSFLLDFFSKIKEQNEDAVLLLIGGNGNLEGQVRDKVCELGLCGDVIFAGVRSDIPNLLSAMDVFVMPSLFEGMPNTVIEAQATGLPCVISDTITKEADITGLLSYLPLEKPDLWAKIVLEKATTKRTDTRQKFIDNGYDIESTVEKFVKLVFGE